MKVLLGYFDFYRCLGNIKTCRCQLSIQLCDPFNAPETLIVIIKYLITTTRSFWLSTDMSFNTRLTSKHTYDFVAKNATTTTAAATTNATCLLMHLAH